MGTSVGNKIKAQNKYCRENSIPRFAPFDGKCFGCKRNIYERYTIGEASKGLLTGCPWCNMSFVS